MQISRISNNTTQRNCIQGEKMKAVSFSGIRAKAVKTGASKINKSLKFRIGLIKALNTKGKKGWKKAGAIALNVLLFPFYLAYQGIKWGVVKPAKWIGKQIGKLAKAIGSIFKKKPKRQAPAETSLGQAIKENNRFRPNRKKPRFVEAKKKLKDANKPIKAQGPAIPMPQGNLKTV